MESVHIGFIGDLEQKAERDYYSGILRFLADNDAPWEVQTFDPCSATDEQLLQFRNWSPAGLVGDSGFLRMLARRLAANRLRRHVTVYMNGENVPRRPKDNPDIRLDDSGISETAATLLMKRGLSNFAYVDELAQSPIPNPQSPIPNPQSPFK